MSAPPAAVMRKLSYRKFSRKRIAFRGSDGLLDFGDDLPGRVAQVFDGDDRQAGIGQDGFALLDIGAFQAHH